MIQVCVFPYFRLADFLTIFLHDIIGDANYINRWHVKTQFASNNARVGRVIITSMLSIAWPISIHSRVVQVRNLY